jgi:hypothetical protein
LRLRMKLRLKAQRRPLLMIQLQLRNLPNN